MHTDRRKLIGYDTEVICHSMVIRQAKWLALLVSASDRPSV
ncbi:hypothetical protein [Microcoleus sp. AT3-D2]